MALCNYTSVNIVHRKTHRSQTNTYNIQRLVAVPKSDSASKVQANGLGGQGNVNDYQT